MGVLISNRADFRARKVIRNKAGHYIMRKGLNLQKDIIIFNVYTSNNRMSNYGRLKLIEVQGEIN